MQPSEIDVFAVYRDEQRALPAYITACLHTCSTMLNKLRLMEKITNCVHLKM